MEKLIMEDKKFNLLQLLKGLKDSDIEKDKPINLNVAFRAGWNCYLTAPLTCVLYEKDDDLVYLSNSFAGEGDERYKRLTIDSLYSKIKDIDDNTDVVFEIYSYDQHECCNNPVVCEKEPLFWLCEQSNAIQFTFNADFINFSR